MRSKEKSSKSDRLIDPSLWALLVCSDTRANKLPGVMFEVLYGKVRLSESSLSMKERGYCACTSIHSV